MSDENFCPKVQQAFLISAVVAVAVMQDVVQLAGLLALTAAALATGALWALVPTFMGFYLLEGIHVVGKCLALSFLIGDLSKTPAMEKAIGRLAKLTLTCQGLSLAIILFH